MGVIWASVVPVPGGGTGLPPAAADQPLPPADRRPDAEFRGLFPQDRLDLGARRLQPQAAAAELEDPSEHDLPLAYRELGFRNFQQYVEDRLAISPRWANYLVCMVRKARRFGVSRETLAEVQVSETMEIFRLDDPQRAREMVEETAEKGTPLKEVKRRVAAALGQAEADEPQPVRKVWYFAESQWAVVSQAIKAVQMNAGSDSETYAVEPICADYLAGIGLDAEPEQSTSE